MIRSATTGIHAHRDRRKMSTLLPLFVLLAVCAAQQPEGCQVEPSSGVHLSVACRLRSMSLGLALHSLDPSVGRDQVSELSVECADPAEGLPVVQLTPSAFAAFGRLQSLALDACRISELASGTFHGLDKLQSLRIQTRNAEWPAATLTLADDLLNQIGQLTHLDLAFNDLRALPSSLCHLQHLIQLNVTSNRLQDLSALRSESCGSSLKVLDASYNRILQLSSKHLIHLNQLEELHLQGNGLVSVQDASLDGLTSLRLLNLAGNHITSLPPGLFSQSSQLTELYAAANGLSVLAPGLFQNLDNLLVIDLSDNQLTSSSLTGSQTFAGLQRLAVLSLHNNRITRLDSSLFNDLAALQILRLDGNAIESLPDGLLASLNNLHTLILSRNRLTHVDSRSLSSLSSLALLALDNNLIERVHDQAFHNCTQLKDLNLSGNNLPVVPVALAVLEQLQSLDLGENRLHAFDFEILSKMSHLSSLRLLDNQIGNISRSTFAQLPSLKILNLSKNGIHVLEQGAFAHNPLLQAIRLDSNQIGDISGLFHDLPNLVWLNISDNRIVHFDYALIPKSLQWLDLHANQIQELGNYFQLDDQLSLQTLDASFNRLTELTAAMLPDSLQVLSLNDNQISQVNDLCKF